MESSRGSKELRLTFYFMLFHFSIYLIALHFKFLLYIFMEQCEGLFLQTKCNEPVCFSLPMIIPVLSLPVSARYVTHLREP